MNHQTEACERLPTASPVVNGGGLRQAPEWALGLEIKVVDFISNYTMEGRLDSFTPGEVRVSLSDPLSERRAVTLRFASFVLEGEVSYCRHNARGYKAHIAIHDVDENGLRKEPRFPLNLSGRLHGPNGKLVPIVITDVCRDGLAFEAGIELTEGQPIAFACGSVFVFAVVRDCRRVAGCVVHADVLIQQVVHPPGRSASNENQVAVLRKLLDRSRSAA